MELRHRDARLRRGRRDDERLGRGRYRRRIAGSPDSESLDELNARGLPAYAEIIARHADEDGVVAIVGHGGSIDWAMPEFTGNVTLPFALANGLRNTGIVQVDLSGGRSYVSNWQGTPIAWPGEVAPVPLPAAGGLLAAAAGLLALRGARPDPRPGRRHAGSGCGPRDIDWLVNIPISTPGSGRPASFPQF